MDILIHKLNKDGTGRYLETISSHSDVDVKLEDLSPPKYGCFAELHPLPKVDDFHIPVWEDGAWVVKAKAFYERPDYSYDWDEESEMWVKQEIPEREPSILDSENLIKIIVALKDKIENGTEIPSEVGELVEAEKVKLEPVVEEPIIKELTR